jgi:hypothetical protein
VFNRSSGAHARRRTGGRFGGKPAGHGKPLGESQPSLDRKIALNAGSPLALFGLAGRPRGASKSAVACRRPRLALVNRFLYPPCAGNRFVVANLGSPPTVAE